MPACPSTGAKTLEERMQEAAVVSVGSGKGVVKDEGDDRAEKASARVRVAAFEFLAAVAADALITASAEGIAAIVCRANPGEQHHTDAAVIANAGEGIA